MILEDVNEERERQMLVHGEPTGLVEPREEVVHRRMILEEVNEERQRQKLVHGYDTKHDDDENMGVSLASAALNYVGEFVLLLSPLVDPKKRKGTMPFDPYADYPFSWPWGSEYWKPSTPRRMLIKAIALLVAQVERMDREQEAEEHRKILDQMKEEQ